MAQDSMVERLHLGEGDMPLPLPTVSAEYDHAYADANLILALPLSDRQIVERAMNGVIYDVVGGVAFVPAMGMG